MQIGLIGLGTMGASLARNAARNGADVVVYNRTKDKTDQFLKDHGTEGSFAGANSLKDFVEMLSAPRAIVLMIKAGEATNHMAHELVPMLSKGDAIIDAGNSDYRDTKKLEQELAAKGIKFIGMGVSGGEKGALEGPSMMPGGDKAAVEQVMPLLQKMAADDGKGGKCVSFVGPGGAGHFVKMVHNGIEYAIMQLIAEAYHLLKVEGKMSNSELAKTFGEWSTSEELGSYLLEITAEIFKKKDPETKQDIIDVIKDVTGQKGTGKLTVEAGYAYGVAVPSIAAAVDARIISSGKDFRITESARWSLAKGDMSTPKDLVERVKTALELSISNVYAQGFVLLQVASKEEQWNLNLPEIARIWRGGCIIRSTMLPKYQKIFAGDKTAAKEMIDRFSADAQRAWRSVVALGAEKAIPLPAISASLSYFDAYRSAWLPQNLTVAQRDFFGAHTYQRVDKEGVFHTQWE